MHDADLDRVLAKRNLFFEKTYTNKAIKPDDVRTDVSALDREKSSRQIPAERPCTKGQYESLLTTAIAGLGYKPGACRLGAADQDSGRLRSGDRWRAQVLKPIERPEGQPTCRRESLFLWWMTIPPCSEA
jgi:hypothetical protein